MLPEADLPLRVIDSHAYIDFLGPQDQPWLQILIDEMSRWVGRKKRELAERLVEPLPCEAPPFKRRAASRFLLRRWPTARVAQVPPIELRGRLFAAQARALRGRDELLDEQAHHYGLGRDQIEAALFADLPGEKIVRPLPSPADPGALATDINLAIAQAVLMRAASVDLQLRGAVRPVVRLAKLHGLICVVRAPTGGSPPILEISGPFSLFQHTLLYGRALAALLPHLMWTQQFQLRASVRVRGRIAVLTLDSSAPIRPAKAPAPFDSLLETRFARDLAALSIEWDLVREPEAVPAAGTLIFPDFALQHRMFPERRVLIELVGFWTPAYLAAKVAHLRDAAVHNLIVCVDEARACVTETQLRETGGLPKHLVVLPFRKRVDAQAVLNAALRMTGNHPI